MLGGPLFLYLTQQNLFEAWMGYASAFAAAVPALLRYLGLFRGQAGGHE
jgi:hypothetical protein